MQVNSTASQKWRGKNNYRKSRQKENYGRDWIQVSSPHDDLPN
jgi:hypothetical protein